MEFSCLPFANLRLFIRAHFTNSKQLQVLSLLLLLIAIVDLKLFRITSR